MKAQGSRKKQIHIFTGESRVYRICTLAWQLLVLQVLTVLCALPLVSAGASLTSMYYVLLKVVRGEESYIARDFFSAFRREWKASTALWFIKLLFLLPLVMDLLIVQYAPEVLPKGMIYPVLILAFSIQILLIFVFPLQSHFENSIAKTIENALRLGISQLPRALAVLVLYALPVWLALRSYMVFPLVLMFGLTLPGYLAVRLYEPVFARLDEEVNGEKIEQKVFQSAGETVKE